MPRKQSKAQTTDTIAPTDIEEAEYRAAVARCKAAIADISKKQWILGDEATTVTKKYGENRLEQFAEDINFPGAYCTLGRYRDVCRAWPKNRVRPRFFASAQILARHDDRWGIVERNPDISKAEARELMRKFRADHPDEDRAEEDDPTEEEEDTVPTPGATTSAPAKAKAAGNEKGGNGKVSSDKNKGWFNKLVKRCNEDIDEAAIVDQRMDAEQLRNLLGGIEPDLLKTVKEAGEAWLKLYDFLIWLCKEGPQAVAEELERRAKGNAAKADLVERKRHVKKAPTAQAEAAA
jgi:hypothetical protein